MLEENINEFLYILVVGKTFLTISQNLEAIREILDTSDYTNIF